MTATVRGLLHAMVLAAALLPGSRVLANPLEAKRLYEEARRLEHGPLPAQVRAWRAVLAAASESDRTYRRALEALASAYRKAERPHAAAALEARAAGLGPVRDRRRLSSVLRLARALRDEGDLAAAAPLSEEVATEARAVSASLADQARALQAADRRDHGDLVGLEALARTLERERAGLALRLDVVGDLGVLRLDGGDEEGARRALRDAQRLYHQSQETDDDASLRCARLWLRLPLRRRLAELAAGD